MKYKIANCLFCLASLAGLLMSCSGAGNTGAQRNDLAASDNNTVVAVVPPVVAEPPDNAGEVAETPLFQAGDYDTAIQGAAAALTSNPGDSRLKERLADAYIDRAWYYKSKRLNPYTLTDLFKAIEIAPDYYRAHYELGRFHNNQWQFGIGIFDLNKAISLKPDFAPAYSERAYSKYKNQKYDEGLADANKAIELDDSRAQFYCTRSLIYIATGRQVLAIEDADRAVRMAPSDAYTYYSRSIVYTAAGQPDLAMADLETTLKLSGDDLLTTRANDDLQKLRK